MSSLYVGELAFGRITKDELDTCKKMCQRLEWWPDYDADELISFIKEHEITEDELIDILNAFSLDPAYVMGRIKGTVSPRNIFYNEEKEKTYSARSYQDENICFITCYNNQRELDEMNAWIDRLLIPDGMKVQRAQIIGASSMCSGYNRAMKASFAKYKVYLHQDVRILNPYFIYDIVECFLRNPQAGMIGLMGAETVPESGVMWQAKRYGAVVHTEGSADHFADTFDENSPYGQDFFAAMADGFLIATNTDIPWREDLFKGWHFYDASESLEFTKRGYRIVIPTQGPTWCLHDFGQIGWERYTDEQEIFVEEYLKNKKSIGGETVIKSSLREFVCEGDYESAAGLMDGNLKSELDNLKNDPEYCVLAASAYLETGNTERAFDIITMGLLADSKYYELYLSLGDYYVRTDINSAALCYYQALFYCDNETDRPIIEDYVADALDHGADISPASFVIVTRNQSDSLKRCIDSIKSTVIPDLYEIVVVDNDSADDTSKWASCSDKIKYVRNDENKGYVAAANQGIKQASPDNDIFLLDADTILLDNSFFYLMLALYSDEKIGIVSCATNDFIQDQKMSTGCDDLEESMKLAAAVNSPMRNAIEDAVSVSDFAMLIRRCALMDAGVFDETFSPDTYEDKDLCVRVHKIGYRVALCFNSYVFKTCDRHAIYLDAPETEAKNNRSFQEKWGCSIDYSNNVRSNLLEMIDKNSEDAIEVLELGCAMGATLNRIKRLWPNSKVYGIEYVESVAAIGSTICDIIRGDVESMEIPYREKQFDYILCPDVLEHLRDPEATIRRFMPYLKDDGCFIISLPNVRHYTILMQLGLLGRFDYGDDGILDRTHLKFFTKDTATEMLQRAGLEVVEMRRNINQVNSQADEFISKLQTAFEVACPDEMRVFQYFFLARKKR